MDWLVPRHSSYNYLLGTTPQIRPSKINEEKKIKFSLLTIIHRIFILTLSKVDLFNGIYIHFYYWQNLHAELERKVIEVILTSGKFTKNIKGRKTDVLDCMWIQKLHSLGLLSGSFLPEDLALKMRAYIRQRKNISQQSARFLKKCKTI